MCASEVSTTSRTRIPAIQVPCSEPRSRRTKPCFSSAISQCIRETDSWSITRSACGLLPMTIRPSLDKTSDRGPVPRSMRSRKRGRGAPSTGWALGVFPKTVASEFTVSPLCPSEIARASKVPRNQLELNELPIFGVCRHDDWKTIRLPSIFIRGSLPTTDKVLYHFERVNALRGRAANQQCTVCLDPPSGPEPRQQQMNHHFTKRVRVA